MYKHYTSSTCTLPLPVYISLEQNHPAYLIDLFVESIPMDEFLADTPSTGRPAFHPRMLLKMILFAYSRKVFSGRKMVEMNEENYPMMWLSQFTKVSYHTLNDFRKSEKTAELIKKAYVLFNSQLREKGLISNNALFIDGTKIEADANKYSFVWKKSIEKHDTKLKETIKAEYEELIAYNVKLSMEEEEMNSSQALLVMINQTEERLEEIEAAIASEPKGIPGGSENKKTRRTLKKHLRRMKKDLLPRKEKYEEAKATFGNRNSFSKTDKDATFMCMKEDPMKNRELKPGYNLQIATNGQYVFAYDIFPNPTDTRTLIPFLKSVPQLDYFNTIVADAGYGSEENYEFVIETLDKTALIPYNNYRKEQTKKFRNSDENRKNWYYDEELDYYVDPKGVRFSFHSYRTTYDKNGFRRDIKEYQADSIQDSIEKEELARTNSGGLRKIKVNQIWDSFKAQVKNNLESESGSRIYAQRKIDVETVFGRMKRNFGVRRTHVRGNLAVKNDIGLLLLTMNLVKYNEEKSSK